MKHFLIVAAFAFAPMPAVGSDFSNDFQMQLDAGRIPSAVSVAQQALASSPDNAEATFALGVAKFLSAAEGLAQGLYGYGLRNEFDNQMLGLAGLPFLRLPVPQNPEPEQVTYAGLRQLLERFVDDLAEAETTLAAIQEGQVSLPLDLGTARLDLDGDGEGGPEEGIAEIFDVLSGGMLFDKYDLKFTFDESDVPWLRGYCHLLMAVAEIPLAHDWERAFEATFHGVFPASDLPGSPLAEEMQRVYEALDAFYARPEGPPSWNRPADMTFDEWRKTEAYRDLEEMRRLETALWGASIADLIVFVHLFDWPVVEAERAASARLHLLSMVELSRESWRRIYAETDDDAEWIPSPSQTGRFRNLRVTDEIVQGWHGFLDEFEALLNGAKLVRHWRFAGDRGVNIRRMFTEPRRLDPVMIAAGPGALPYIEEGAVIDSDTVGTLFDIIGDGFFAYFVWFN